MTEQVKDGISAKPSFVIIGAMKCATSTIHDQLAKQDGISMSEPKEPNFFSDDEQWGRGLAWYSSLFELMPKADIKGESSTHYTKFPTYPDCIDRLHEHLPNVKLIYVMRDPVDRLVSQFIHEWSVNKISKDCSIDQAVEEFSELIDYSRYAMQLEPFIERYGMGAILPVFFERVMDEPQRELARIACFIGYDGDVQWVEDDAQNVSSQRQRRSPMLNVVLNLKLVQGVRRSLLPESFRAKIRSRWTMKDRPTLGDGAIDRIRHQLDPDMAKLGTMLGIDLSCETFKEQVRASALDWVTEESVSE